MSSSFNSLVNSVADQLAHCFSQITETNWNQRSGMVTSLQIKRGEFSCCVGAHVAQFFNFVDPYYDKKNKDTNLYHFSDGIRKIEEMFNLTTEQVKLLFHCAGTPEDPFGEYEWDYIPAEVLDRMRHIETAPPDIESYETTPNPYRNYQIAIESWLIKERENIDKALLPVC